LATGKATRCFTCHKPSPYFCRRSLVRQPRLSVCLSSDLSGQANSNLSGNALDFPTVAKGDVFMPRESLQHKLDRVRKPRVQITYDVEVGDAIEIKELPFVVGVLADLSGQPKESPGRVKDRNFVEIDRDNFDQVLAGSKPRLAYRVPNQLAEDGSQLGVELEFKSLDDFGPEAVAKQIPPIQKLVEARQRLSELAIKINTNERLEELLQDVVQNTEALKQLSSAKAPEETGQSEKKEE